MLIPDIKELNACDLIGKQRALCIDYGNKRVGIAISDISWKIASPFKVLESHGVFFNLFKIIEEYSVGLVVIGAPLSLNGGESGAQHEKVKKFTEKLISLIEEKNLKIDVIFWDERLSSVAANRFLSESEMTFSSKRKNIDKVAASFILQGLLDYLDCAARVSK